MHSYVNENKILKKKVIFLFQKNSKLFEETEVSFHSCLSCFNKKAEVITLLVQLQLERVL